MRTVLILLVVIVLLSSFVFMQDVAVSKEPEITQSELPVMGYKESASCFENSVADEFPVSAICVPDQESAIRIADVVIENFQKDGLYLDYIPLWVNYDTDDEIWVVVYGEALLPGGGLSIAVRKSNAEIVAIWSGE